MERLSLPIQQKVKVTFVVFIYALRSVVLKYKLGNTALLRNYLRQNCFVANGPCWNAGFLVI